jgi:hypothetical protein
MDLVERDESTPYYYTEDAHPPGLHAYEPLKASNNEASITPMVVFDEKKIDDTTVTGRSNSTTDPSLSTVSTSPTVMWESSAIMKKFRPSLYPTEIVKEINAMEDQLAKRLGSPLRCVAYNVFLRKEHHPAVIQLSADPRKVASIESTFFEKFLPRGLASGIRANLQINTESAEASTTELRTIFTEMSALLEESGGQYLMDQAGKPSFGFTAVDLTFAALSYPFLRPPEMYHWLIAERDVPVELASLSKELASTKAGQHALKMYKLHRPVDKESGVAVMKYANRERSFIQWLLGY